jgi:hypothetical protein
MSTAYPPQPEVGDKCDCELAALEHVLETPLVPGELVGWLQDVLRVLIRLGPMVRKQSNTITLSV